MTPAEELTAAADRLDALIRQATYGPWETAREIDGYRADRWTVVRARGKRIVTVDQTRVHHDGNGMAEANVAYIAAMNPLVGKALADWLRVEARRYAKNPPNVQDFFAGDIEGEEGELDYCVRIARLINGSES